MRDHAFFAQDDVIQEEAARLLADIYALYEFETYQIFSDQRDTFYELFSYVADRTERSLLTLAGLARANDDGGAGLRYYAKERTEGVGVLNEGKKRSPLSVREGCNKIIHAKKARFHLDRSESHPIYQRHLDRDFPDMRKTYLRPQLLLAGEHANGRRWEATLDIVQWIHAILHWSTIYARNDIQPRVGGERGSAARASRPRSKRT
jgi:hypothetical protein